MENYEKSYVKEIESSVRLTCLLEDTLHMNVNSGSKIRNLMAFAIKKMHEPSQRQITWNGSGQAVSKVLSCAEIMKRQFKDLHQVTDIRFKRFEEYWEPKIVELERLKVNRDIPAITILLSKDQLDTTLPGYQAPGSASCCFLGNDTTAADAGKMNTRQNKKRQQQRQSTAATTAQFPDFPAIESRHNKEFQRVKKPPHSNAAKRPGLGNKRAAATDNGPNDRETVAAATACDAAENVAATKDSDSNSCRARRVDEEQSMDTSS